MIFFLKKKIIFFYKICFFNIFCFKFLILIFYNIFFIKKIKKFFFDFIINFFFFDFIINFFFFGFYNKFFFKIKIYFPLLPVLDLTKIGIDFGFTKFEPILLIESSGDVAVIGTPINYFPFPYGINKYFGKYLVKIKQFIDSLTLNPLIDYFNFFFSNLKFDFNYFIKKKKIFIFKFTWVKIFSFFIFSSFYERFSFLYTYIYILILKKLLIFFFLFLKVVNFFFKFFYIGIQIFFLIFKKLLIIFIYCYYKINDYMNNVEFEIQKKNNKLKKIFSDRKIGKFFLILLKGFNKIYIKYDSFTYFYKIFFFIKTIFFCFLELLIPKFLLSCRLGYFGNGFYGFYYTYIDIDFPFYKKYKKYKKYILKGYTKFIHFG